MFSSRVLALACLSLFASSAIAAAQAPITYAGQGAQPTQVASLPGADERSYGYGQQRERQGAVIDLRRGRNAEQQAQPSQAQPQTPARASEEGAQPWLERERVGPPYEANGRWYVPTPEPGYEQTGEASWYGPNFHGERTASGETYDQEGLTAAHTTLPLNSLVQVTNLDNGREIIVRVNDRGPFVGERLIDLTRAGAEILGFEQAGGARVHVRYLGPAPRRVNADGVSAPLPVQTPAPAPARVAQAPSSDDSGLAGGPMSLVPEQRDEQPAPRLAEPQIQTAAYTPPTAQGAFMVQLGAFSDVGNAQRVRASAEGTGPVEIDVRRTSAGRELFRVRVGPFASASEAEEARMTLAGMGYPDAVVAQR